MKLTVYINNVNYFKIAKENLCIQNVKNQK